MIVWKLSFVLLTISCFVLPSSSTSIFDLIEWGISDKGPENRAEDSTEGQRSCNCEGSSCLCCVDFNITYVDLGGPGCVMIKYLSQDEGFAVNVSYGNSLLNSQVVKGANPAPTCINLLTRVVQLCARLTDLAPTSEGLRGCLQLEPTLLRESQLEFPLGCFRSGPEGMSMEKINATKEEAPEEKPTTEEPSSINTAQIIQVVNESAEQGIAFFSNLLGLAFGRNNATDTSDDDDDDDDDEAVIPESNTNSQSESKTNQRKSKQFYFNRGPNDV